MGLRPAPVFIRVPQDNSAEPRMLRLTGVSMKNGLGIALLLSAAALVACGDKPKEVVLSKIPAVVHTIGGDGLKDTASCAEAEAAGFVLVVGPLPVINSGVVWRLAKTPDGATSGYCHQPIG